MKRLIVGLSPGRGEAFRAVIALLNQREYLPDDSVVHLIHPGIDFYQWATLVMLRPDVQLIITDPAGLTRDFVLSESQLHQAWAHIAQVNPLLILNSPEIKSFQDFMRAVSKLIIDPYYLTVPYHDSKLDAVLSKLPFAEKSHFIKADQVWARIPENLATPLLLTQLRDDGVLWLVTEPNNRKKGTYAEYPLADSHEDWIELHSRFELYQPSLRSMLFTAPDGQPLDAQTYQEGVGVFLVRKIPSETSDPN